MLRVCLAMGVGSGAVLVVLGVAGISAVVALAVAMAGVSVDASVIAAGLAGVSCGSRMLVGVDDGSGLVASDGSPPEAGM